MLDALSPGPNGGGAVPPPEEALYEPWNKHPVAAVIHPATARYARKPIQIGMNNRNRGVRWHLKILQYAR